MMKKSQGLWPLWSITVTDHEAIMIMIMSCSCGDCYSGTIKNLDQGQIILGIANVKI